MIQVKDISKIYGKGNTAFQALQNISFDIPDNASVAIVGRSGSGKSTLMHVISGLDRPQSGQIIINGQDILQLKAKDVDIFRSTKMGFVFQAFFVQADETAFANVSLALEIGHPSAGRTELVDAALAKVGLTDKRNIKAKNLSGGQKQRLAIARAIVGNPKIIFADEPTGNLDSTTGKVVEDMLFNLNHQLGSTLIIVTHDSALAARCDMQIQLLDGRIEQIITTPATPQAQGASHAI